MFGKETFFEKSAKIPLIFAGNGIVRNRKTDVLASIMDLGPTLLELAGAKPMMEVDGRSLAGYMKDGIIENKDNEGNENVVYSEYLSVPTEEAVMVSVRMQSTVTVSW